MEKKQNAFKKSLENVKKYLNENPKVEIFRDVVNAPHRGAGAARRAIQKAKPIKAVKERRKRIKANPNKKVWGVKATAIDLTLATPGAVAKTAGVITTGAAQFLLWLGTRYALDNPLLRKTGRGLSKLKNKKNKQGNDAKFWSLVGKNPNISAWILYAAMMTPITLVGIKQAPDKFNDVKDKIKKEWFKNNKENNKEIVIQKTENTRYKLETDADFDALFKKTLPLICLSMFPTETLSLGTYSDNKSGVKNTIGLGSYWYPENGDIYSADWIKVSKHKGVQAEGFSISGNRAMDMAATWSTHREHGRVYKKIRRLLLGAELTVNELAAVYTCTYNNERNGWDLCRFVRNNYQNPIKCASYLVDLPIYGYDGLLDRHCHEALVYLNLDNYIAKIPEMEIRDISTSVTALETAEFYPMAVDLRKGKLDGALKVAQKIEKRILKNGQKVKDIVKTDISGARADEMLASVYVVSSPDASKDIGIEYAFDADGAYQQGLSKYARSDYSGALADFLSIVKNGYDGADIRNDVAITYYHLGMHRKSIKESKRALKMSEGEACAAPWFNMGLCYEKMGNLEKALDSYAKSSELSPDAKVYKNVVNRIRREIDLKNSEKSKSKMAKKSKFDSSKAKLDAKNARNKVSFDKFNLNRGRV